MGDKLRSKSRVFDLFIVLRTPRIEKFKVYILAQIRAADDQSDSRILI